MNTIALNMIVAPGEASLLRECLTSFDAKDRFDEIVIVNTSNDDQIDIVAKDFNAKCIHFQWNSEEFPFGNFAGARNCALDNTESDYFMWLDTDDVLIDDLKEKFQATINIIKDEKNSHVQAYAMPYAVIVDEKLQPITTTMRERIFRRDAVRWDHAVHELTYPEWQYLKNAKLNGIWVTHLPQKPSCDSAERNIKILEHEYFTKDRKDVQTKWHLARDYMVNSMPEKGIPLLKEIVENIESSSEMMYAACLELCWYYSYGHYMVNPRHNEMQFEKYAHEIEKWVRLALAFSENYAEPYVLLGDLYAHKINLPVAEQCYLLALQKKINAGKVTTASYYEEIPAARLSDIALHNREFERALHFNKRAILHNEKEVSYIVKRKEILLKLINEYNTNYNLYGEI